MQWMSLEQLIREYVHPEMSIVIGASHEALIPFAAVAEIIRQGITDLTVIAPISDIAVDLLVGAGAVRTVKSAWVGNVTGGLGHAYRRAIEEGIPRPVEIVDYSNYTLGLALEAGARNVPFLPVRSLLGTDLLTSRAGFELFRWHGETLVAVPALVPDLTILAVQVADQDGNVRIDGPRAMARTAAFASRQVIVTTETVVSRQQGAASPDAITIPGVVVSAGAVVPFGAHPSPVLGYYGRDTAFFQTYHQETRTVAGFRRWVDEWITMPGSHLGYLDKLGPARLATLRDEAGVAQWND